MRVKSPLRILALAATLVVPLAPVAMAGDHSGNQWWQDDDNRRVARLYEQPNPYLAQTERDAYRADVDRFAQNQRVPWGQPIPPAAD